MRLFQTETTPLFSLIESAGGPTVFIKSIICLFTTEKAIYIIRINPSTNKIQRAVLEEWNFELMCFIRVREKRWKKGLTSP